MKTTQYLLNLEILHCKSFQIVKLLKNILYFQTKSVSTAAAGLSGLPPFQANPKEQELPTEC